MQKIIFFAGILIFAAASAVSAISARHYYLRGLVAFEDVAGVDLVLHVVEARVIPIRDDGLALGLEFGEVVDHQASEESGAVVEGGFVDNHLGAFGFDAFHHALDGTLAEVVAVALHRQAVDADGGNLIQF